MLTGIGRWGFVRLATCGSSSASNVPEVLAQQSAGSDDDTVLGKAFRLCLEFSSSISSEGIAVCQVFVEL